MKHDIEWMANLPELGGSIRLSLEKWRQARARAVEAAQEADTMATELERQIKLAWTQEEIDRARRLAAGHLS